MAKTEIDFTHKSILNNLKHSYDTTYEPIFGESHYKDNNHSSLCEIPRPESASFANIQTLNYNKYSIEVVFRIFQTFRTYTRYEMTTKKKQINIDSKRCSSWIVTFGCNHTFTLLTFPLSLIKTCLIVIMW